MAMDKEKSLYGQIMAELEANHVGLKSGDTIIFYDKEAVDFVIDALENNKYISDFEFGIRKWNDNVHASAFFCWTYTYERIITLNFDYYV